MHFVISQFGWISWHSSFKDPQIKIFAKFKHAKFNTHKENSSHREIYLQLVIATTHRISSDCSLVILVCQFHFHGVVNQTKANKTSICHSHNDVFLLLRPEFISFFHVWNRSQHIAYWPQCLVWNQKKLALCSIVKVFHLQTFSCVQLTNFWVSLIMFDYQAQSKSIKPLSLLEFDYQTFDWLHQAFFIFSCNKVNL